MCSSGAAVTIDSYVYTFLLQRNLDEIAAAFKNTCGTVRPVSVGVKKLEL